MLSTVFARFLEDNHLITPPRIAGPGQQLETCARRTYLFFQDRERAKQTNREYLLDIFDSLAQLPGTRDVFGEHNAIRDLPQWLGPDAAGEILRFFQRVDSETGHLVHDFTDPTWDTRFS